MARKVMVNGLDIGYIPPASALDVVYNNSASGITSQTVQGAIDELADGGGGSGGGGSIIRVYGLTNYIGDQVTLKYDGSQIVSKTITADMMELSCKEIGSVTISVVQPPSSTPTFEKTLVILYYSLYTVDAANKITYGFKIAKSTSDPSTRVEYIEDAVNMTPASMNFSTGQFDYGSWGDAFFMPRPCMLRYDGTVDYYLDPNDFSKKLDGTSSDYQNTSYLGNVMIEFPKIWVKRTEDSSYQYVYIANHKIDNSTYCYANLDSNGNEIEYFYVSAYECSAVSGKARSLSNQSISTTTTCSDEIDLARANEATPSLQQWYIAQWCDRAVINDLLVLISRSTDAQTAFGAGHQRGGSSSMLNPGQLDDKGLFWGDTSGTGAVRVFGIENYWGNTTKRVAGLLASSNSLFAKMTWSRADGSGVAGYQFDSVTGYLSTSITLSGTASGGYISQTSASNLGMLPVVASGTSSTYWCDGLWYTTSGLNCASVGGGCNTNAACGPFCFDVSEGPSAAYWVTGMYLSCKPLAPTA